MPFLSGSMPLALPLLVLLAVPSPAAAQQPAARPNRTGVATTQTCPQVHTALMTRPRGRATRGAAVEGITEYTLPNGLRVLLFPDPSKPTATVNITYLVGSRHEGYGETGMAHLLEHMVFKGTPCHENIPQELTEHGARPNGTTWLDRTNYFETFSATDANLTWALDLESDRMRNSYIARSDLETEFSVVRNEFESGENDPFGVLEERVLNVAFLWHNYGKSTIGARSDIEQVPIERLQAFYHKYYQPDNAVLVVAGKFDEAKTLRMIEDKFGRMPRPVRTGAMKIWPTYTAEPTQDGERSVTLRRVGDVQVTMAVYHVPAGSSEDYAAVQVLSQLLGDQPSGRLYQALVATKLAASVGTEDYQLKEPGVLVAFAQVRKESSLDSANAALRSALAEVVSRPPTEEEVNRARTSLIKNIELLLSRSDRVGLDLSEWAASGDWRLLFVHRDRLKMVTAADVARVAAAYLKPANVTYGTFIPTDNPQRAEIPPAPDVAAIVKDYRGDTALAQGEAFDPSPDNIDSRTQWTALPSGLKLALLAKRTRGQTVNLRLVLRFGSLATLTNKSVSADLAADMLMRGTRNRTRQQIQDEFDRLKARVSLFGSATSAQATIETTRPNLIPALRLLGEVLREPVFDAREFDALRQENLAALEEQRAEPTTQGSRAFGRYLNPFPKGDPRYTATVDEDVADYTATTLEDARRFYAEFYGASNGELSAVGDFDPAELTQAITTIFGDWKSPQSFTRVPRELKAVAPTTISLETPDKANAFFLAGLTMPVQDTDPDYPALVLGNYLLGGGFLNSRLAVRIRQKEGISYGVGSSVNAAALDRVGSFTTFAIYAPENATRLEAAFREELDRALHDGFTAEEVQAARDGWLQSQQVTRAQDASLSTLLGNGLFLGRTLTFDKAFEARVAALTPATINAAMQKYIDPAKLVIVKAGDFAKGAPATPKP
ncbi:MAG: pitrilysin family protein [Gemmatimonadales bacterium]